MHECELARFGGPEYMDLHYLQALNATLNEWEIDEDEQAYKDL